MRSWKRWVALLPVLAAVVVIWPISWGGQLGYVTTHGISMEPRFHTGDLAVVHPQRTYHVGQVTAYHNRMLRTVVLHRIVAINGDSYTFKGDNNSWLDQERPQRSQLVGALVLRVPAGGVWLHRLTSPPLLGMLAFALLTAGGARRRRRKGRMSRHAAPRRRPHRTPPTCDRTAPLAVVGATAAVVVTAALTGVAWLLPTTHVTPHKVQRTQTMTMSYSAVVRPSPAYDGTIVTAPQPVFRNITDAITLQASYRGAPGDLRVDARLSTPGGWTSTINLVPTSRFSNDFNSVRVPVRLSSLDRRARAAGRVTGLPTSPVTITVVPRVTDGRGFVFAPEFPLTLTALALTGPADPSGLTATTAESLTQMRRSTATVHLLRHTLSVNSARRLTMGALALAVLLAGALLGAANVQGSRGEADHIQRRWRELLLEVHPTPNPPGRPVVDVPVFEALARLAQRYELLILHWDRSGVHTYVVQDGTTVFRYRTGGTTSAAGSADGRAGNLESESRRDAVDRNI
jgi:signal peptidase I